jgi:leader peptidase (prepilin peptidase) / N-methyltransferase
MTAFRIVAFALLGLAVGSFLTVVTHRVPRHESVIRPRSRCPGCGTEIRSRDNVPVLSYLLLRGRCRTCGRPIGIRYPLVEVATGALFAGAAAQFRHLATAAIMALFFGVMVALAVIDLDLRIIPNRIVVPAIPVFAVLLVLAVVIGDPLSLGQAGLGLLVLGGWLMLVAVISGGMGFGDVKLGGLIGLVLGALGLDHVAVAAAVAILAGGIGGLIVLIMLIPRLRREAYRGRDIARALLRRPIPNVRERFGAGAAAGVALALVRQGHRPTFIAVRMGAAGRKSAIPFGPYLALGAVVSAFVASPVAHWYTSHLA